MTFVTREAARSSTSPAAMRRSTGSSKDRRVSEQRAEALVAGWEAEAVERGLQPHSHDFWHDAPAWITEQLEGK